ncbi:MAG: phenylalanine--tRNA ligase subunit beta [Rickettsiales bacterium]|jgi:phenylalanyl-tRNA synthetase beta chain|nr:phenylalanine--tRNA ligase subunit beta [Rickettsiales bacterium]
MKFTFSWLKEFLDVGVDADEVADTLNKIGLEVDEFTDYGKKYAGFSCAEVAECENHPNSDHLRVCAVKTAEGNILSIVCGAPNVRKGMKSILAPAGSVLPNGVEIKKSKIRGVDSCGMLCSEKELDLGNDHRGIIDLSPDIPLGMGAGEIFGLNDVLFDISITPNHNDCLCVYGIARDLSCAGLGKLKQLKQPALAEKFRSGVKLSVNDKNCPLFLFREIKNVKNRESPEWLRKRLISIGVNPRNALVDAANYVMYCFNAPLHCYDADKIIGGINLCPAKNGEEFVDLFGKKHSLGDGNTVIADDEKKICLAGIIGAESSLSSMETKNILVECAIFDPLNTAKTGRQLNIQTDSRYRFERGSDYNMVKFSLDCVCELIMDICGGEASEVIKYEEKDYKKSVARTLELPLDRVEKLLGIAIDKKTITNILSKSGYKINFEKDIFKLEIPTWKNNILVREDVIDDIIRFYGYEHLRDEDFKKNDVFEKEGNAFVKNLSDKIHGIRKRLAINGLSEVISYSFTKRRDNEFFAETTDRLELLNPIISELSYMRQNILINLINIVRKNNNRGFENISLFEVGKLFTTNEINREILAVGGIRSGQNKEKNAFKDGRDFDIYDVKKDLFDVLDVFSIGEDKIFIDKKTPDYYHPGRSGAVLLGKTVLGYFGELHPTVSGEFSLKRRTMVFEVFLNNLPERFIMGKAPQKTYAANDLPPAERSFAFAVGLGVNAGDILRDVRSLDKELIEKVSLFDVYQGEKNGDEKSIAFQVTIQPKIATLNRGEIDELSEKIISFVEKKYGGKLRDGKYNIFQ